jgi:hypothetical protein
MEKPRKSIESHHTVIIGLGKATHHLLADRKPGEPHVLSSRGSEVLQAVKSRYDQIVKAGKEVRVIFTGKNPNYTAPQKLVPFLRQHVPTAPQAELFKVAAVETGVGEEHITAIPKGTDMMQNLIAVKNHFADLGVKPKIEIFVDGHQAKRAEMVAKHVFDGYELEVKPVYTPRNLGMRLFETFIYEPVETVYMWAGVRVHRAMQK